MHGLGAKHERVIADAVLVDLSGECRRADLSEALFRFVIDPASEQVRSVFSVIP
jgi:hypothetical protein